jgi:hypothetical protein
VSICTEQKNLKSCIQNELLSVKFNLLTNQTLKSIRPYTSSNDIDDSGAHFPYTLFIELLKQMPQTKQAKDIMLNKCRDNKQEIELIEQFRNLYTSTGAIDWYTRESFVYRLVNRAFLTEDITLWYLFRYFIIDLCTQLDKVHKEQNIRTSLTFYRGQAHMPTNEVLHIKKKGGWIVFE